MITKKDYSWIKVAKKMIKNSQKKKYKMSSLLVSGGRLINIGLNCYGPPAFFINVPNKWTTRHCEINSLLMIDVAHCTKGLLH